MNKFLVLFCLIFAVSSFAAECTVPAKFAELVTKDPVAAAKSVANSPDARLLAVAGFTIETPGIPGIADCWLEAGLAEIIPGTTDAFCSKKHKEFNVRAKSFAMRFNEQLFRLRRDLRNHSCAA
jgi:hypothetical protein